VAKVKAVCLSNTKGNAKTAVDCVELQTNFGITGDAHASAETHRQVSLMDEKSINVMCQKGYNPANGDFGENIITTELPVAEIGIGTVLQLGDAAQLKITQIGKACHAPCAIGRRMGECIMPKEGIFAVVLKSGLVRAGDEIQFINQIGRQVIQVAVITASDRCSQGQTTDTSGPLVGRMLTESLGCNIAEQCVVPDKQDIIAKRLKQFSELERLIDLIFTTGGTGFAPRDVTPEATLSIIDRQAPGIAEAIRQKSLAITPKAMLSRAVAGIRNRSLIINLPGSEKAVRETLEIILPVLPHAVEVLRGEQSDCGRT